MRPQPSQIVKTFKVVGGSLSFDRRMPIQAGLTGYDVMLVGASGGYGGRSYHNNSNYCYGAGPGGGGMIRAQGALVDLPDDVMTLVSGVEGSNGSDTGNASRGGMGSVGGDSSFNGLVAYGGKGGQGGRVDFSSSLGTTANLANGGDGGQNSLGVGSGGAGSEGEATNVFPNHTPATQGLAVATGGYGGGGETGRARGNGNDLFDAKVGKAGNVGEGYDSPGGSVSSNRGGGGGGADISPITGSTVEEYYGTVASEPKGVAYLKLT